MEQMNEQTNWKTICSHMRGIKTKEINIIPLSLLQLFLLVLFLWQATVMEL
jgi:biopolymer transport protein ExbD